ncbi:hypothetical protein LTR09_012566 [Extremus antarcticus]|uniref:Uncharacterized protein n=1 Tax=Extremus antarcticus TaxID=702011 RepID=A0AAJ0G3R1_9PEZI|nr:hypothetical protein LTR09_012566 [Extremus antarcticus]
MTPVITIFSALDMEYRNRRAKAVAPLFSPIRLRKASEPDGAIRSSITKLVDQLRAFRNGGIPADIIDLAARCSIDVVTGYLLGEQFAGMDEFKDLSVDARQFQKLSANAFIFNIVAFSRISLLPNWLFQYAIMLSS